MNFPAESATKVVSALVLENSGLFAAYRHLHGDDDLISEGLTAACRAWPDYNPSFGTKPETFIHMVAYRRLLDLAKMAKPRKKHEARFLEIRPKFQAAPELAEALEWDDGRSLHEWARDIYQTARRVLTDARYRRGRHCYNIAQVVAIAMLRRRLKRSTRDIADLLKEDKQLRHALHLYLPPKYKWIWRADQIVREMGLFGEVETENQENSVKVSSRILPSLQPSAA